MVVITSTLTTYFLVTGLFLILQVKISAGNFNKTPNHPSPPVLDDY